MQKLIDRIEDQVAEGRRMPLGGGTLVDRQLMFDLIDRLRVAGPDSTTTLVGAGDEDVAALQRSEVEARAQLARAEEEVMRLRRELDQRIGDKEVTRIAEERGRATLVEADLAAQRVMKGAEEQAAERLAQAARVAAQQLEEADSYALQLLQRLEEQIALFLENVRSGIEQLEGKRGTNSQVERYTHEPMIAPEYDEEDGGSGEESANAREPGSTRPFPWMDS